MEQPPKRRLIIRKKLLPPVTNVNNCTFSPITISILKKCPCGGYYTSDSEYTPRECCSSICTNGDHYKLFDGRYTPDYTPIEVVDEKQKFYSGFEKPVIYDFTSDTIKCQQTFGTAEPELAATKGLEHQNKPSTKETTSGFNIMPASQLRETQRDRRDWRDDKRDNRNTSRDWRDDKRDNRNTSRDWRDDKRDNRNDRDYHRNTPRDYARNTRFKDESNIYNGARREPSKFKADLDSELRTINYQS
jgi:hypothetical protein